MYNGVNNTRVDFMSTTDLCGQRVLGMNGSLKNWINTGSADVVQYSKNQTPVTPNKPNNKFKDIIKGAIIALGAVSAGALIFKGKKIDFAKVKKYFDKNISKIKASSCVKNIEKGAKNAVKETQEGAKKTIKAFDKIKSSQFNKPKFEIELPYKKRKQKAALKAAQKSASKAKNNQIKNKKTFREFLSSIFSKFKKKNASNVVIKNTASTQTSQPIVLPQVKTNEVLALPPAKTPLLLPEGKVDNAVDEIVDEVKPNKLYSGNPKIRKTTLTQVQKQQKELEQFDIEDIIAEFSDKEPKKYTGKVDARKQTQTKFEKQTSLPKSIVQIGDEFEITDSNGLTSSVLRFEIDENGKPVFAEIKPEQPSKPVYSEKQKALMEANRLKRIEQSDKQLKEAMQYIQEEIKEKLQKIKEFNYGYFLLHSKYGFDKDIVVSKRLIDELDKVGFPFNVKPDDILDILEIDDMKIGECYRFMYDPNPRFKIGKHKINSANLRTLVAITKKQDGNLAFIYI